MVAIGFEWNPAKARSTVKEHQVSFEEAMAVFRDPLAFSVLDPANAEKERWITIGMASSGNLALVVHTRTDIEAERVIVRIESAPRPTRNEARQYREGI